MMRNKTFVTLMTIMMVIMALTGCSSDENSSPIPNPPKVKTIGFIGGFKHLDSISVDPVSNICIDTEHHVFSESPANRLTLAVSVIDNIEKSMPTGTSYINYGVAAGSAKYQEEYVRLLRSIGDTLYSGVKENYLGLFTNVWQYAIVDSITAVSIVSDIAVDDEHPAGTDLSDLFFLVYEDYLYKIQHHYQSYRGENALKMPLSDNSSVRCEPLRCIGEQGKRFIGTSFFLYSELPYQGMADSQLTVSVQTDRGTVALAVVRF